MDKLEAVIQHNEADISTWEPHEYDLNLTYADDIVAFSPYLRSLARGHPRQYEAEDRGRTENRMRKAPEPYGSGAYFVDPPRQASLTI